MKRSKKMRAVGFGERLVQITRYPWLFPVSVYLVREDDGFTLIDTGLSGSEQEILEVAGRYGGRVRRIVLTHAHADHTGSLDALREALPEAEVLERVMNLAEEPHSKAGCSVSSVHRRSLVSRIRKRFQSEFITASR
jgi:glyoxylase-like metal-dependent hydrolase (beta-lactamase superfamily II)